MISQPCLVSQPGSEGNSTHPAAKSHVGLGHGLDGTLRFRAIVGADGYLMDASWVDQLRAKILGGSPQSVSWL